MQSVVTQLRPSHFLDVHSYARTILFPWGMDDDQGREPTQNFHNPDWDRTGPHHGRDGVGGTYGEYLPSEMAAGHTAIARRMRDAIRDQAGPHPTARPPARSTPSNKRSVSTRRPAPLTTTARG